MCRPRLSLDTIVDLSLHHPSTETDLLCEFGAWSDVSFICHLVSHRSRSQALSSEASVDEGGVFESLKAETASPPALFSGLAGGLPAGPFPAGLVLGSTAGGGDVFIPMPATRDEASGRSAEGSTYHHRQAHHHFHHGAHRGGSLLQHVGGDHRGHAEEGVDEQPGTPAPALSELKAVVCWLQKGLPFILILLAKLCFQHKLGESQRALSSWEGLHMPRARTKQ